MVMTALGFGLTAYIMGFCSVPIKFYRLYKSFDFFDHKGISCSVLVSDVSCMGFYFMELLKAEFPEEDLFSALQVHFTNGHRAVNFHIRFLETRSVSSALDRYWFINKEILEPVSGICVSPSNLLALQ